ncbi:LysR family transcriptional regulator [Enterococcus massiliensis]|uniref:LysR family transcriptional regulator n=1 Tax=Enterococcus massiliensis TaxID=1640685 RepID=UPI00065E4C14|nr:LysR family transcriptional regulator [Enterococcus massiliensis]
MFQLLQTFVSVYETKNFTQSAERLFLSQPTVSAQIKKLEDQLGVILFLRNGKQEIVPTVEAAFLYPRVLQILEEWQDTEKRLIDHENFRERCVIACSHTCAIYFLPKFLPELVERFPLIDFSLLMMNSDDVVHQMEQNKVDIGFIEKAERSEVLVQAPIYKDELVLAGKADSKYWLLRENDSALRFYNEVYLKQHNLTPNMIYVNNSEAILALLREGIGKAIISKLSVDSGITWEPLKENNIRDFFLLTHKVIFRKILIEVAEAIEEIVAKMNKESLE